MASLPDAVLRSAYDAHGGELLRFAHRALGDAALAEDAVQEAFLRAWRASASYDPARASQRTWLFAILRNVVIDLARSRRARPQLANGDGHDQADGHDDIERALTAWEVDAAMARLSPAHREALVEVHWRGRPYAEVAAALAIPEGTLKSRVYHALRALRAELEQQGWRDG